MAAQPELHTRRPLEAPAPRDLRPSATIITWQRPDAARRQSPDAAPGTPAGAARGLLIGLCIGAVLWAAILWGVWSVLR